VNVSNGSLKVLVNVSDKNPHYEYCFVILSQRSQVPT